MLCQLFVLSLSLFGLSHAVASCNSVTLTEEGAHGAVVMPTNVCIVKDHDSIQESMKMVCDSSGVGKMQLFEDNLMCSGAPTSVEDPCRFGIDFGAFSPACVSTAICDSTPCTYTQLQIYEGVTECDGDSAVAWADYTKMGMVFDETCVDLSASQPGPVSYSYSVTCVDDAQVMAYYSTSDCSGDVTQSDPLIETQCDVASATAHLVSCEQVAPGAPQPPIASSSPPNSCDALDIDHFLSSCSSLWDPLPDISKSNFNRQASCSAVAIDDFLGECSDRWQSATQTIEGNTETLRKLSDFQATSCESLEINEFLSECSDIYSYIDARFAALSHPDVDTFAAQAVGGDVDTSGVTNTLLGMHTHTVLLVSVMTNVVLVCVGCFMMNSLRKVQKFKSYHHPEAVFEESH